MKKIKSTTDDIIMVDDEDYQLLSQYRWYVSELPTRKWASSYKNKKKIIMHRLIMKVTDTKTHVDHIDHNGLNNQKSNLRPCSRAQNNHNRNKTSKPKTSKYKGVHFDKSKQKWVSSIGLNGKNIYVGAFDLEIGAAKAYNNAALNYYGEFAVVNIIKDGEDEIREGN